MSTYSPLREQEQEGIEYQTSSSNGCSGCFGRLFCLEYWQHGHGGDQRSLLQEDQHLQESWMVKKLKSLKEVSEVVAGPKWKNFLRKMGKYFNSKKSRTQHQYDAQSYALNFDNGDDQEEENGVLLHAFSARFAGPIPDHPPKSAGL